MWKADRSMVKKAKKTLVNGVYINWKNGW